MALTNFSMEPFSHGGITHDVYSNGVGPCVLVAAEIPGITPEVIRFAEDLLVAGFSVAMPSMFGVPGSEPTAGRITRTLARACISAEFHAMATRDNSKATEWLRGLARKLHADHGGPGIGFCGDVFHWWVRTGDAARRCGDCSGAEPADAAVSYWCQTTG